MSATCTIQPSGAATYTASTTIIPDSDPEGFFTGQIERTVFSFTITPGYRFVKYDYTVTSYYNGSQSSSDAHTSTNINTEFDDSHYVYPGLQVTIDEYCTDIVATFEYIGPVDDATLSYNLMGGTGNFPTQSYQHEVGTVVSETIPVRNGYIFRGWSLSSAATTVDYSPGDVFRYGGAGAHTLYAVWIAESGTISTIIHVARNEEDEYSDAGDIATFTATWTITSISGLACRGSITWSLTGIEPGYELSRIDFLHGTDRIGSGYTNTGTVSGLSWTVDGLPDTAIAYWVFTGADLHYSVAAVDESGTPTQHGTVKIFPSNATSVTVAGNTALTFIATPGTDWKFLYWRKAGEGVDLSTDTSYTIIANSGNTGAYEGYFKDKRTKYDVSLTISPQSAVTAGATVGGAGQYSIGDTIVFTATGTEDYEFEKFKMKGYSFSSESNPYQWKLSEQDVEMTTEWIAYFKASSMYQVLTKVNRAVGTFTKSGSGNMFPAGYELTLTATVANAYQSKYACTSIGYTQGSSIKNEHLSYSDFQNGMEYTYDVDADAVWMAYFTGYGIVNLMSRGALYRNINAYVGKPYGYGESLPTPTLSGYFFTGWYTEDDSSDDGYENGEKVTDETIVPEAVMTGGSPYYALYAHWSSSTTKFYINGLLSNYIVGSVTINTPARGYFFANETCRIDVERSSDWNAHLFVYKYTSVLTRGSIWTEVNREGVPFEFVVGDHVDWAYGGDQAGEKKIDIRFNYEDEGVTVTTSEIPADRSLGYVDALDHVRYLPEDTVTAKAILVGYGLLVRWEQKIHGEDWKKYDPDVFTPLEKQFEAGEGGSEIRGVFGVTGATLYYDTNGGAPPISPQTYTTNAAVTLSDGNGVARVGYSLIGWGDDASDVEPDYGLGQEAYFSQRGVTLYAVWYGTPQQIGTFLHYKALTGEPYEGTPPGSATAQVSSIQRTSALGTLQGNLTWTVTMPEEEGSDAIPEVSFARIEFCPSESGTPLLSSEEQSKESPGEVVNFPCTSSIANEWVGKIYYSTDYEYVATFDANGGENAPAPIAYVTGVPFTISTQEPTWEGHAFIGWSLDKDATEADVQPGQEFLPRIGPIYENMVFYAVWRTGTTVSTIRHYDRTAQEYSATPLSAAYVWTTAQRSGSLNTYTINWQITNVTAGYELSKTSTIVVTATRAGTVATGNGATGASEYKTTEDLSQSTWTATIYYVQSYYVLSYDTRGGSPAIESQTVEISEGRTTVSDKIPRRKGYYFLGWTENPQGIDAQYQPGDTIEITENTTLYALYENDESESSGDASDESPYDPDIMFTVYGKPDSSTRGSVSPAKVQYKEGETVTFTATASLGYRFAYWSKSSGGVPLSTDATYSFTGTAAENGLVYWAVFSSKDVDYTSLLIYDDETGLLMSYKRQDGTETLIWDDNGAAD